MRLERLKDAAPYAKLTVQSLRARLEDGTLTKYRSGPKLILVDLDEIDAKLIRPAAAAGTTKAG